MIKSFKDKLTGKVFYREFVKKFAAIETAARKKLLMIDAAEEITDLLTPPSNHLEMLKGDRKGQRSIRINDQYRVCFIWKNDGAYDVEIVDYH
ncbi:MAG: hypothetical protein HOB79_03585 [Rhodospirillaceae bacterium]|jgi:proteic killer suppression protein|nr:hypothetical protein [Rhodospirillaceae bacterium]MBT7484757.1 hypothetical protein [Rhodospirillales bacterium]MBT4700132.1 hypothetical protein [Rhodospirillaceae bacterium]MBT5033521.1 hypothetical protein [Rhodospirillaceae bacterium]MBT6219470.1 hypothetical protein [Rhodospirillaceae bacterium]